MKTKAYVLVEEDWNWYEIHGIVFSEREARNWEHSKGRGWRGYYPFTVNINVSNSG